MSALESTDSVRAGSGKSAEASSSASASGSGSGRMSPRDVIYEDAAPKKKKKKKNDKGISSTGTGEKKKKKKKQSPLPPDDDDEKMASFCALMVYKKTKVTDEDRWVIRKWCLALAAFACVQFAVGGYLFNLTSEKYEPRRGSWYVGIAPVGIIIWGWRVQTHTGLCINLALSAFSALIALAGGLLDLSTASLMLELNACEGFGSIAWFNSPAGDQNQVAALTTCINKSFTNEILPANVCMCTAGTKNACVSPYELIAADSCQALEPYGGLLFFAFLLCIACFVCNVMLVLKEISIINIRARQVEAKYADMYAV